MRLIVKLLLAATLVWSAYWVLAAQVIERQSAAIFARPALIEGTANPVAGFPFSFRTTLDALHWRSSDGLRAWQADRLALVAASYQPNQIAFEFPEQQDIGLFGLTSSLHTEVMLGGLTLGADLTVRSAQFTLEKARLDPPLLLDTLRDMEIHLAQQAGSGSMYTLNTDANALVLAPGTLALIDPDDTLPDQLEKLRLNAELAFAAPIHAQRHMPDLTMIRITGAELDWGPLQMQAEGQITRSTTGTLEGQITLRLPDWRPFHALLVANGSLPPDAAMMAGMFLASQTQAGSHAITLPLDLRDSIVSLGPFMLMRLPPV